MQKGVKWLLVLAVLAVAVNLLMRNNAPQTPEDLAAKEQAAKYETARKAYYEHPVIAALEIARKLEGINGKFTKGIEPGVQSVQRFASSKGAEPLDKQSIIQAALHFDDMAKAYGDYVVPMTLPGDSPILLTGACADLKKSAEAGREAFYLLKNIMDGKPGKMATVNTFMTETVQYRNSGMEKLNKAKALLAGMEAPQEPQRGKL